MRAATRSTVASQFARLKIATPNVGGVSMSTVGTGVPASQAVANRDGTPSVHVIRSHALPASFKSAKAAITLPGLAGSHFAERPPDCCHPSSLQSAVLDSIPVLPPSAARDTAPNIPAGVVVVDRVATFRQHLVARSVHAVLLPSFVLPNR